jgi:hypothetical protein
MNKMNHFDPSDVSITNELYVVCFKADTTKLFNNNNKFIDVYKHQ